MTKESMQSIAEPIKHPCFMCKHATYLVEGGYVTCTLWDKLVKNKCQFYDNPKEGFIGPQEVKDAK